jgi:hypothetical protein
MSDMENNYCQTSKGHRALVDLGMTNWSFKRAKLAAPRAPNLELGLAGFYPSEPVRP